MGGLDRLFRCEPLVSRQRVAPQPIPASRPSAEWGAAWKISSHSMALGVELELSLQRRNCIQISQRIGVRPTLAVERAKTANSAVAARAPHKR